MDGKRLQDVPLFSGLNRKDLALVAQAADEVDTREGEVLARQGDIGHEFFVIERGRAEVTRDGDRIATLGPGDFFGEMALISEERRTATVTALDAMTCVVMSGKGFRGLKRNAPEVFERVRSVIESRRSPVS